MAPIPSVDLLGRTIEQLRRSLGVSRRRNRTAATCAVLHISLKLHKSANSRPNRPKLTPEAPRPPADAPPRKTRFIESFSPGGRGMYGTASPSVSKITIWRLPSPDVGYRQLPAACGLADRMPRMGLRISDIGEIRYLVYLVPYIPT